MSAPRDLARLLAQLMADGQLRRLPVLTPDAPPKFVRDLLLAYYELRDLIAAEVREHGSAMTLQERVAASAVRQSLDEAISSAERSLRAIARRGGRGQLPIGPKWQPREVSA